MRVETCDICQKQPKDNSSHFNNDLTQLVDRFQTKTVKEICSNCLKKLNKRLDEIRIKQSKDQKILLKEYISKLTK